MEITIKRFEELTVDELYEILRWRTEVFVVEQDCVYQDMDGDDAKSVHLFMMRHGHLQAYLRVVEPGVKFPTAAIGRFLIPKALRGRGWARPMMAAAIEVAKTMSPEVTIEAQTYLKGFYESLGFRQVSDEYIHEHRPHIRMMLP